MDCFADARNDGIVFSAIGFAPNKGRQRHGFFGHGTAPEQASSTSGHDHPMFAPGNYGPRIDSVANTAFMSFPEASSHHGSRHFNDTRREQLRTLITALIKALPQRGSSIDRFFEEHTSSTVIDRLCDVAEAVCAARVFKDLVQPATDLAQAMQGVGLPRWPGFLRVAAERADDLSRLQAQAPAATPAPRAETKETTAPASPGK